MAPVRSQSTLTSMAYNARTRLGFQILLRLHESGLIDEKKIPANVTKMIRIWANMKKGRKHHNQRTIPGGLVSLLDDVPASTSEDICPERIAKRVEAEGELLLVDGYIVIYPVSLGDTWSYRRTLAGDQLLKVAGYS